MQNVNHAIDNLRRLTGLDRLEFDAGGNLTLVFDGGTPVNFARLDDTTIEVWSGVAGLSDPGDATTLRGLLEANHLGEGTGSARLALAPGRDSVVVCERLDVTALDDTQFADRIIGFLKYVTFWNSLEAARSIAARSGGIASAEYEPSFIRV